MSNSLNSALNTATTGIDAFAAGINTVGQNISNQTSSGYAVRSVDPQTAANGSAQAGSGVVDPVLVQRASDAFAAARVYGATASSQAAKSLSSALSTIDQSFTGNGDVHKAATTFFADLNTLASEPTNSAQRSTVIADAQNLIGAFTSAASGLTSQYTQIGTQVSQQVGQANTLLDQLATINKQLKASPNSLSLLDKQQAALTRLSSYMNISTIPLGSTGAIGVLAGGTVLVDQSGAQTISASQPNPSDPPALTAGNNKVPLQLSSTSGSIGGALAGFTATANANKQLDWFAGVFASTVNQSQAEGLNGSGSPGTSLFSVPGPVVTPAGNNAGSATLAATVTNPSALPSNGQGYSLTYTGTGWTATVPGTHHSYTLGAGPALTLNGINLNVTGAPKPGDTFQVNPEPGAATDIALTTTNPSSIAAADPYQAVAGTVSASGTVTNNNAGTIAENTDTVVSSPSSGAAVIPASNYGNKFQIQFTSSSAYNVVDTTTGSTVTTGTFSGGNTDIAIAYPSGSPAAGKYWQVNLTGSPAKGDVATLSTGGLNSGSNAQRMAKQWTATSSTLPGGSLQGSILSIVGAAGSQSSAARTLATNTSANLKTAQSNLSQVAGVNQDQQAVLLTQYQQAYQAAAKVITTAASMFQSLLQAV